MPRKPLVPPLVGPRCRLRLLEAADLPLTLRWRNQDHIRSRFVHSDVLTWEQHLGWFQKYEQKDDDFLFVIESQDGAPRPVGQVGLYRIDWQAGHAEFGRILIGEADAAGRGLAREATALILDLAFRHWNFRIVDLEVFADNDRAIRLYERCGFERTGQDGRLQKMQARRGGFELRPRRRGTALR